MRNAASALGALQSQAQQAASPLGEAKTGRISEAATWRSEFGAETDAG